MTLTETIGNSTYYTKTVLDGDTILGVVEPTFTDGEWSAVITDNRAQNAIHGKFKEKYFKDEDDAHFWIMKNLIKYK